jgi:hypothetical protein
MLVEFDFENGTLPNNTPILFFGLVCRQIRLGPGRSHNPLPGTLIH